MSSSYTAESVYRLLRHLVAPVFIDRARADKLLFSILSASGDQENPRLAALFDEATELFGDTLPGFLEALVIFWLNAGAAAHRARMKDFAIGAGWQPLPEPAVFALKDRARLAPASLIGMGIGEYLVSQAKHLRFLLPTIERGLQNPEPAIADHCWEILAANAADAAPVLPAMCALAFARGPYFAPGWPMRGLAAVIDANPTQVSQLANALAIDAADERVAVVAEVARYLQTAPSILAEAMYSAFMRIGTGVQRYLLFRGLARMARRGSPALRERLLAQAQEMIGSEDVELRSASPWGLALLGDLAQQEPMLLALLGDPESLVRLDACAALGECSEPTPALVNAVAARLGDYEGNEQPHQQAWAALIAWKERAMPALAAIADWLQRVDLSMDEVYAESVLELLSALGPAAQRLWPQIERYLAIMYAGSEASTGEDSQPAEEFVPSSPLERQSVPSASDRFAVSLGFDIHEHIPGSPDWDALANEPDGEARLRSWLREAREG
ncbi:MAG TPA: hypothetical protein VN153_08200 [Tahibacter sp.]|nr:hypothetical protein [Tahibacter sp.]